MSVKQEAVDVNRTHQPDGSGSTSDAAKFSTPFVPNVATFEDAEVQEDEFLILRGLINDLSKQRNLLEVSLRRGEQWKATAARLANESLPEVHIGLFGATGTGKSSLLNCLLDRDILEKRGDGDACTAFVSRVAWNDDPITHGRVTFVTQEIWEAEIEIFLNVLNDGVTNAVEDAVAYVKKEESQIWAKLSAVYPSLSGLIRPGMAVADILSLDTGLINCFGTTLDFYGEDADDLADNLCAAVHQTSQKASDNEFVDVDVNDQPPSSFWPLVAEVEYRVDAEILRGVVLVDLPGVQDSNAARDQIALKYLGRLDHIFVVAGAVRASDSNPFAGKLAPGIKQIINASGFNVTLVATQGDVCLLPTKALVNDDAEARAAKEEYWELERQIKESERLRRQLEAQAKQQSTALKKYGKKRPRSPTDIGIASSKRRQILQPSETSGAGRHLVTEGVQSGNHNKDMNEQMKMQTELLESLREKQEVLRPSLLRLAAVERRQNILTNWPQRFVDAVSAHTGEGGERALPAAFCTSAENHRKLQLTSDNGSDPGIDSLQRHVQQLGRDRRNVFLRSFMRDIQAHALSIKSFLEVTEEETRGSDEDLERDAGIARFMLRWYSASIDEVKKDDHGIFSTAFQAFEAVCDQLEEDMVNVLSQALIGSLRAASHTASGASLQTFNDLVSIVKWNTLLAFMRRDGVFHSDWNDSMVSRLKDDVLGTWTQTFKQLDLLQKDHTRVQDLRDELSIVFGQIRESAAQDESRALLAPRVDDFATKAAVNAENAIQTALDAAQAKLTHGQREISRSMADKLQTELLGAYAFARAADPGIGVALRTKTNFRERLQHVNVQAFENVAEKTVDDVRALLRDVCSNLRAALFRCAVTMETDISVLWARIESGGTGDSELFLRRVASEVVAQVLDHIAKSPFYEPGR